MDAADAGGVFSRAHFIPPFVIPFHCPGDNVHWRAGQSAHERGKKNSQKRESARGSEQRYGLGRLERWSVIPEQGITLGSLISRKTP